MNKGKNVLICLGLLMIIYFLFSGTVIEGITTYMKGSVGTLCDSGKHIASKKECGEALKSLDLSTKEWWTGNEKEMPPHCSVSADSNFEQAQWNESVVGKGHESSFPICKGDDGPMTPEEADTKLSKEARMHLRGIGNELKELGNLRNKKRRTPVNIHIDVGDGPGSTSNVGPAKEAFSLFPPTLGFRNGNLEGFLEGIGEPNKNDYGLQNQSKDNGDIRNVSQYVSQEKTDQASLQNKPLNGANCTETDHRGCRFWGIDNEATEEKKKREVQAQKYQIQIEANYKMELENWKLEEEAKKDNYSKEKDIWDKQQQNFKDQKEEKQQMETQKRDDIKQETVIQQKMQKDNLKVDMKEQLNKLVNNAVWRSDNPNDPNTLIGKANKLYASDLRQWLASERAAHGGKILDPNPPSLREVNENTSDEVISVLTAAQAATRPASVRAAKIQAAQPQQQPQQQQPQQQQPQQQQAGMPTSGPSKFRKWDGNGQSRYGIKKIIYDRNQKISPKLQRELGVGVHDIKNTHKQVIRQKGWYEWLFGK